MKIELLARGVFIDQGHVLLAVNNNKGHLYLPGGHIEFAEGARVALIREMMEETGLKVQVKQFIGAVEHAWRGNNRTHAEINLLFSMTCSSLKAPHPPVSREPKISFTWNTLDELPSINFQPAILQKLLPSWVSDPEPARWASSMDR